MNPLAAMPKDTVPLLRRPVRLIPTVQGSQFRRKLCRLRRGGRQAERHGKAGHHHGLH